ncbi:hypothetical protein RC54_00030 [Herbaspirillum rubrisubalbicans]|uniref:Uncharacterized protein n=2 Tax=Herbaspirillum rubrisubalbicans TaxID=80842 RepID=A0AAD0U4B6_9BURK|nr:hypothetical protein RC54_00030 [Herbaspirillum rubrisubalbicans]
MVEVASYLDPAAINRTSLQAKMGGTILKEFRKSVQTAEVHFPTVGPIGRAAADLFDELNSKRSDIVHAYPITNSSNAQILHRRLDTKGKHFEVTNEFLNGFISRLEDVSDQLYKIRKIVRPDLDD